MKQPIKLHWSASKPNFGDALSPLICEAVSGRKVTYETIKRCDLVSTGSLLQRLPEHFYNRRIHVWGSGFIEQRKPYRSRHHFHAVRGELSKAIVQPNSELTLGDPGLLAHLLVNKPFPAKLHNVGLIAHYKDKADPLLSQLVDKYPNVTLIDIFLPPKEFLFKLQSCEVIFSSAMHGLIAADALGIPNARIQLSNKIRGGDFKFDDYYSVFEQSSEPVELAINNLMQQVELVTEKYQRPNINEIQQQLIDHFPLL